MKTRLSIEFKVPKKKRERVVVPFKRECESLIGRYFVGQGQVIYVDKIKKDTYPYDELSWIVMVHHISTENDSIQDGSELAWNLKTYEDIIANYVEITAEEYHEVLTWTHAHHTTITTRLLSSIEK